MGLNGLGRLLVGAGVVLVVLGAVFVGAARVGLGRLPGDLSFGGGNVRVYVPLATCLLVSLAGTIVLNLFLRR